MQAISMDEAKKLTQQCQSIHNIAYILAAMLPLCLALFRDPLGPGWEWLGRTPLFFTSLGMAAAPGVAGWVCRKRNISLGGKTSCSVKRRQGGELYPLNENVEVRPDYLRSFLIFLLMVPVTLWLVLPYWPPDIPPHILVLNVALIIFSVGMLCATPFVWLNRREPALMVSDSGITYCNEWRVRAGFIDWQEIDSCELEVERNAFGTLKRQTFRFRDSSGNQLGALSVGEPYIVKQRDKLDCCWLLIQKRLTGEYDESTLPVMELFPNAASASSVTV